MNNYLGIEIGGTKLQLVSGTADGVIAERTRFQVDAGEGAAAIRQRIEETIPKLIDQFHPTAIGVGFGGPVNRQTGHIAKSHQVEGWSEFPIVDWLTGLSALPTLVENDANTAALGEATCGAGRGKNPVFYINMGSGIGGGLVVGACVYHGQSPGETEIGHIRLTAKETLEDRCSGWVVDRRIREAVAAHPDSLLARNVSGDDCSEARFLLQSMNDGDADARRIFSDTTRDIAFALSHVTHLFHPEVIVLGGGLSLIGEPFRDAIGAALSKFIMEVFLPGPQVVLAKLTEDAVPVGALVLAATSRKQHAD